MARFLQVQNNVVVWSDTGRPCREIGANCYQAIERLRLGMPPIHREAFALMAGYGIEVTRISAAVVGSAATYTQWLSSPATVRAEIQTVLDAAAARNISVILNLFWNWQALPEASGVAVDFSSAGAATTTITNLSAAWTGAGATRTNATNFINDIVGTFINHPAVAAWEVGNEWADSAWDRFSSFDAARWGYGSGTDGNPGVSNMRTALAWAAGQIRAADPNRLILSGHGTYAATSDWVTRRDRWIADNPAPLDTVTVHPYPSSAVLGANNDHLPYALRDLRVASAQRPVVLGEFGINTIYRTGGRASATALSAGTTYWQSASDAEFALRRGCDAVIEANVPLALLWDVNLPYNETLNGTWHNQEGWTIWRGSANEWLLGVAAEYQQRLDLLAKSPTAVDHRKLWRKSFG